MVKFLRVFVMLLIVGIPASLGCAQKKVEIYSYTNDRNRGWLGVEVQDVTPKLEKKKNLGVHNGAYVAEVIENSPAENAGIQKGDVIVKFNGKEIDDSNDLIRAVRKTKPKTDVEIEFYRKSEKKSLMVTLGKIPRSQTFSFALPPEPKIFPFNFHFFSQSEVYGLRVQTLSKQLAEYFAIPEKQGVLVTEVKKNSAAIEAGFKAGDVIVKVNEERIEDTEDLMEALSDKDSNEEIVFEVVRRGKSTILKMKLEEEDDDFSSLELFSFREKFEYVPFLEKLLEDDFERLQDNMEILKERMEQNKEQLHRKIRRQFEQFQIKI